MANLSTDFLEHAAVCTSQYDGLVRDMATEILALRKALRSAASTAHYRGTLRGASELCHGTFDECTNCQSWKDAL